MVSLSNKKIGGVLAALALLAAAPLAHADDPNGGLGLRLGVNSQYKRATGSYETPTWWRYDFGGNWGHIDLSGDLAVSYWWANDGRKPNTMWQLAATPFFRWWLGDRFFVEAGVGPSVFNKTVFADHTISTAFQFADQIGVGYQLTPSNRISLRYSHFSNASIKTPNPGLDVTELTYTYSF
jgi:lipid A 3-O-deacylase